MQRKFGIAVLAALVASPLAANAQAPASGAASGAAAGHAARAPIGAAAGAAGDLISADLAPRFRDFVLGEHRAAIRFDESVTPGARLPLSGVTYYPVPAEYGVDRRYRYTVVNDHVVLVDSATRRIVQVVN